MYDPLVPTAASMLTPLPSARFASQVKPIRPKAFHQRMGATVTSGAERGAGFTVPDLCQNATTQGRN
jgi:hypothetical protein